MISKDKSVADSSQEIRAKIPSNTRSHLHGAAVIDANGKETPITEQMIQKACTKFISDWESSSNQSH